MNTFLLAALSGLLTAGGLLLCVTTLTQPLHAATLRIQQHASGPRLARTGPGLLAGLVLDLSIRLKPEIDLEARLQRAGWVYASPADYYARRMLFALVGVAGTILYAFAAALLQHPPGVLGVALAASLAALFGFWLPGHRLRRSLQLRRDQLEREMGFGLDRISLFLQSGSPLLDALSLAGGPGLFGSACEQIAAQAGTGLPISDVLQLVQQDLPHSPALDEFLGLVRMGIQKGQAVQEPFRQRAAAMRDMLRRAIIENGQRARIRVTLLTSLFILIASMLVTVLPITLLFEQQGLF